MKTDLSLLTHGTAQPGIHTPQDRQRVRELTIEWANQIMGWQIKWETGIYPSEMAAFLGLCRWAGIRSVAESGRGEHAYSTQTLGAFGKQTGVKVISIDFAPCIPSRTGRS